MNDAFDRVLVLGAVDPAALPRCDHISFLPPDTVGAGAGPLPVDAAIGWARTQRAGKQRVLVITDRDLFIPECASLFGFADTRAGVALVSTFRLSTPDQAQWNSRVANAIAHERGHLDGLRHCKRSCLMRPATDAAELDSRPLVPCGKCPRRWTWVTKSVIALFVLLAAIAIASRVLEWRAPLRVAPALPAVFSAAFAELPRDPDEVFSRPVTVVAHLLGGSSDAVPLLADATLPPGLTTTTLPQFALAITSAMFRTVNPKPVVHVHVIDTRPGAPSLWRALGCSGSEAGDSAYAVCHVRREASDAHVIAPRAGRRVIVVFSAEVDGRAMAERLAATVGTSAGLLRDRDLNLLVGALPATPPAALTLYSIVASNVHRVPEAIDQLAGHMLGGNPPGAAQQFRRVMPLAIAAASYHNAAGAQATIVIGDYGSGASAWINGQLLHRMVTLGLGDNVTIGGSSARRVTSGTRRGFLFRRGQFVVAVYGENDAATDALLIALATAVQL